MIKLSSLLTIDSQYPSERAIKECLGDQYLYANNPIFRKVRDAAIEAGVNYSAADTSFWRDYQVCSLFCLQSILDRKLIPYIDNAPSLERLLLNTDPDFALNATLLLQLVKRNYLLHESAHCVANAIASGIDWKKGDWNSQVEYSICMALVAEAFANLVERLAFAIAGNGTDLVYFNLNSHVDYDAEKRNSMRKAIADLGIETTFKLGLISLFINNISRRKPTQDEIDSVIDYCVPERASATGRSFLLFLILKSFTISNNFLQETTPAYFRLIKQEAEFLALSNGQFPAARVEKLIGLPLLRSLIGFLPANTIQEGAYAELR